MRPGPLVIFDGQSLNNVPNPGSFPAVLCNTLHVGAFANVALSGIAWAQLANDVASRVAPIAAQAERTIAVLTGGTSDIYLNGSTGAQTYALLLTYVGLLTAAGVDQFIVNTISPSTALTGPQETARQAFNALLLANTAGFAAVSDAPSRAPMNNPADLTYYADGTHYTAAGAAIVAAALAPIVAAVL